jgi:glycosyltransferase involved in cell wall biosynthesis
LSSSGRSAEPVAPEDETKLGGDRAERVQEGIVVCIPAHNEQGTIAPVILGAMKVAGTVLVCDDGSTDMTAAVARRLGARVLTHARNLGKGAGLGTLMEEARRLGPKVVVTIDADGQHDAGEIPAVIGPVMKGESDVVIGVRQAKGGAMPRERIIGNRVLDEATSRKAGMKLEDTQSGFRAYSARALAALDFTERGMATESQILIDAAKAGLKIVGVPVSTTYVGTRPKRNPVTQFSGVLDYVLSRTIVDSPLLYLGLPGLIAVLVGIAAGSWVVNSFFETHQLAVGTGLISAILIITGTIVLATALILKFLKAELAR